MLVWEKENLLVTLSSFNDPIMEPVLFVDKIGKGVSLTMEIIQSMDSTPGVESGGTNSEYFLFVNSY
jgi:hypothetical protein